jgi:hypothetical protein
LRGDFSIEQTPVPPQTRNLERPPRPSRATAQKPLDPDLVRFVEALAVADARRDHYAALAAREAAKSGK